MLRMVNLLLRVYVGLPEMAIVAKPVKTAHGNKAVFTE